MHNIKQKKTFSAYSRPSDTKPCITCKKEVSAEHHNKFKGFCLSCMAKDELKRIDGEQQRQKAVFSVIADVVR